MALAGGLIAAGAASAAVESRVRLANGCFTVESLAGPGFLAAAGEGYEAGARRSRATSFYLKPTDLRTYLVHDQEGRLLGEAGGRAQRVTAPGPNAEWAIEPAGPQGTFVIRSTANGGLLTTAPGRLEISATREESRSRFRFQPATGCRAYPEARTFASGASPRAVRRDGTLFGFADMHVHLTAEFRAGGRVVHGGLFDRFGITRALGGDEDDHGPDGSLDLTGNLLRTGLPVGTHDTSGWPRFAGWPERDTYTHQQVYYGWLKRTWRAGERLAVAQTVEDEALCEIELLRSHSCDEMDAVELQVERLRGLERYVDAQSGGRGRGWLRIVDSPGAARRVIADGKLAVLIGVEASSALGCSEFLGAPQCDERDIDRGLDRLERLGVSSLFIAHWVDNAFAGAALQSGTTGAFISALQLTETGHPFATTRCAGANEAGGNCNRKGLTELGAHLVRELIDRGLLIEVDHLSQRAREAVIEIAEDHGYPLVSSHTGTGGEWTDPQLRRLYRIGGMAAARPDPAPDLAERILELQRSRAPDRYLGIGLGTDTGGFNELPPPRADASEKPLRYPFRPMLCDVRFRKQRTGERTFDLNRDGVAHYGLFADLLADMQRTRRGRRALTPLYRSAEAYVRMWSRAERVAGR
jgi:microsomal dipeptidase-like Zn-dependent dipeptidase